MFRAEMLKLTTTKTPKIAVAVGAGGLILTQIIFVTLLPALAAGTIGPGRAALGDDFPALDLGSTSAQLDALSPFGASSGGGSVGIAVLAVVMMGVLAGTSDYRFGGIVAAALAQPRRVRILTSKAAATGVVGLATGLVFTLVSLATLLGTVAVMGLPLAATPLEIAGVIARGTLAVGALTLIALSIGILARSQLAGVLIMLAIIMLEPIVLSITGLILGHIPAAMQFLPLSLANAVIGTTSSGIPFPLALAGLGAITLALLGLAALALKRRDI